MEWIFKDWVEVASPTELELHDEPPVYRNG